MLCNTVILNPKQKKSFPKGKIKQILYDQTSSPGFYIPTHLYHLIVSHFISSDHVLVHLIVSRRLLSSP